LYFRARVKKLKGVNQGLMNHPILLNENRKFLLSELAPTANYHGWCDLVIKKKFKSRKNQVYLLEKKNYPAMTINQIVVKKYPSCERLEKEVSLLRMLHASGLTVPDIILVQENILFLDYINGVLFLDYLEICEKNFTPAQEMLSVIVKLSNWLNDFYKLTKHHYGKAYSYGDLNARNFILTDDGIWGIDLEDASPLEPPEYDLAGLCANLLTYDPPFTPWKIALSRILYDQFSAIIPLDREQFREIWGPLLNSLAERRKVQIPQDFRL